MKKTSKYTGVSWHPKKEKWVARLMTNGRDKYLGIFKHEKDAAKAYQEEYKRVKTKKSELGLIKRSVQKITSINLALLGKTTPDVRARLLYYKLAQTLTANSLEAIGQAVNRDHSSVLHNLKNFERDILKDPYYSEIYAELLSQLKPMLGKMKIDTELNYIEAKNELRNLRIENNKLKERMKYCVDVHDKSEFNLLSMFRSLDDQEKKDVMFKIETAKKVREQINAK